MADKEIDINVNGAEEVLAATKAAEAERIRLAAQQAMGASGTGGLGGLGGNNFSKGQYQRYSDAYLRAKAGAANREMVDRLRSMRSDAFAVQSGQASFIAQRPPAAGYTSRASKRFADVLGQSADGGAGQAVRRAGGGGRPSAFDPPTTSDAVAWYKQPSIGTNKSWSGLTSSDAAFGKSQISALPTSAAKARGAANVARSLGKGNLPAVARSSLALWAAQEGALAFKGYAREAFKDMHWSASAENHARAFSDHAKVAYADAANNAGQTGLAVIGAAATGVTGLVGMWKFALTGGSGNSFDLAGSVLRWQSKAEGQIERFYTGTSASEKALAKISKGAAKDYEEGEKAYAAGRKYVQQFADRNADELAALGFGSGEQVREMAAASEAAKRLKENIGLRLAGKDEDEWNIEPSNGDD